MTSLDDMLTHPTFFQDPYPTYRRLQDESPVHWCEPWQQWIVTRCDDVLAVTRNTAVFSSAGWEQRFLNLLPGSSNQLANLVRHYQTPVLSNTDPPDHTRLRRLVSKSFSPRLLAQLRPVIDDLVDEQFRAIGWDHEVDLLPAIAYPLPARVIGRMLGAPDDARDSFERWSADIVNFVGTGAPTQERAQSADRSLGEFRRLLAPLLEQRRRRPTDDLLGALVAAEPDGEALSEHELLATAVTLLFAGHETTANLIANTVLCLLRHPAQLQRLRDDPALVGAAVEECLRFESPVQRVRRLTTQDSEIGGVSIPAGASVMAFLGAANRDPSRFDDAHVFDVSRSGPSHVAFGHGIHFCVGAALSRIEAPVVVEQLLDRFGSWKFGAHETPSFRPNITFRGLTTLKVDFR